MRFNLLKLSALAGALAAVAAPVSHAAVRFSEATDALYSDPTHGGRGWVVDFIPRANGGGILYLYGPYRRNGMSTSDSNEAFDQSLRARNEEWGVRDMEDVSEEALEHGLVLEETVPMPANNFSLVYRRAVPSGLAIAAPPASQAVRRVC
jgi:hypothetical protein